jgi:pyruvate dehydrogenase E2 component (dihydrolipoamide acetyltransferase)
LYRVCFRIRAELNAKANDEYKLSLNDFVIKAAAIACRKVPEANSEWHSDEVIRRYHNVDINVAVNTERGLYTPVIKDADLKGLATISNLMKELVKKAQENKLTLEDLQVHLPLCVFSVSQFVLSVFFPRTNLISLSHLDLSH